MFVIVITPKINTLNGQRSDVSKPADANTLWVLCKTQTNYFELLIPLLLHCEIGQPLPLSSLFLSSAVKLDYHASQHNILSGQLHQQFALKSREGYPACIGLVPRLQGLHHLH